MNASRTEFVRVVRRRLWLWISAHCLQAPLNMAKWRHAHFTDVTEPNLYVTTVLP